MLREHARRADAEVDGGGPTRWSFRRDLGTSRLLVLDSRCGRVLGADHREMLDEPEWEWLTAQLEGDHDHLLLGDVGAVPAAPGRAPPRGVRRGASPAASGARARPGWGGAAAGGRPRALGRVRHVVRADDRAARRRRRREDAPATITFLSGDVHFAYLAQARFPAGRR